MTVWKWFLLGGKDCKGKGERLSLPRGFSVFVGLPKKIEKRLNVLFFFWKKRFRLGVDATCKTVKIQWKIE